MSVLALPGGPDERRLTRVRRETEELGPGERVLDGHAFSAREARELRRQGASVTEDRTQALIPLDTARGHAPADANRAENPVVSIVPDVSTGARRDKRDEIARRRDSRHVRFMVLAEGTNPDRIEKRRATVKSIATCREVEEARTEALPGKRKALREGRLPEEGRAPTFEEERSLRQEGFFVSPHHWRGGGGRRPKEPATFVRPANPSVSGTPAEEEPHARFFLKAVSGRPLSFARERAFALAVAGPEARVPPRHGKASGPPPAAAAEAGEDFFVSKVLYESPEAALRSAFARGLGPPGSEKGVRLDTRPSKRRRPFDPAFGSEALFSESERERLKQAGFEGFYGDDRHEMRYHVPAAGKSPHGAFVEVRAAQRKAMSKPSSFPHGSPFPRGEAVKVTVEHAKASADPFQGTREESDRKYAGLEEALSSRFLKETLSPEQWRAFSPVARRVTKDRPEPEKNPAPSEESPSKESPSKEGPSFGLG